MAVPRAKVDEVPAEVAAAASSSPNVCVVLGCSSKGPLRAPQAFGGSAWKTMVATFGAGPGPKAAAYAAAKTDADFVYIRLPATAVAGFTSTPDVTGMTGGASATVTAPVGGAAVDSHEVSIAFPTGGTVGTTGMHYVTTIDGTAGADTALLTATTITVALDGQNYVVHLHTGDTVTNGDVVTFYTLPPSAAILPQTVTRAKAATTPSTASLAASATPGPVDAYEVTAKVIDGGTSDGTAAPGVTISYTLDGGSNWSPKTALTGVSLALFDGKEESGVTVTVGTGTLDSGDTLTFRTTAPEWQGSDAVAALAALRSSNLKWSFLHGIGATDAAKAGSVGTTIAGWAAGTKFSWAALSTRDRGAHEPEASWAARLLANFSLYADTRVAEGAGYTRITCPVTGRRNRRPVMWVVVPRIVANPPSVDPSKKKLRALSSDVAIHDATGQLVEHDARMDPSLHDARFVTLRTYDDEAGVYVTRGNLMGPADDIQRIAYRRVLNIAAEVYQRALTEQLESEIALWGRTVKKPYKPGDLYEPHALRMEREIRAALKSAIVSTGYASSVEVALNRTPVPIGSGQYKLLCTVKITGLAYIDEFEATIGFTDPALDALINSAA